MRQTSQLHIDLGAIDHNLRVVRRVIGADCGICPVIKADAYGLGAPRIARQLIDSGADMLAVYTPEQAGELARAGIGGVPTLVLMPVREITRVDELYRGLISGQLHLTVHDAGHLQDVIALAERFGAMISVHLEVDTGMCRGGCGLAEAPAVLQAIARSRWVRLAGVFTHFARADADVDVTDRQLTAFNAMLDAHAALIPNDCVFHAANTYAAIRHPRFHKSMVRVGLAWAGYGLECLRSGGEVIIEAQELRPILTWTSRIVQLKWVDAGTPVGYGSKWTARRRSLIGLAPVGYADGYPAGAAATDLRPRGALVAVMVRDGVEVRKRFASVVGAVNMDQITIDLTELVDPAGRAEALGVGTGIELITPDAMAPNHLVRLAFAAGAIPTEMMCRLNPRITRTYRGSAATVQVPRRSAVAAG